MTTAVSRGPLYTSFESTDQIAGAFLVSVSKLGEMIGPVILATLSEACRRLPMCHTTTALSVLFAMIASSSTSVAMLIASRFLLGMSVASSNLSCCIVCDMFRVEQPGRALAIIGFVLFLAVRYGLMASQAGIRYNRFGALIYNMIVKLLMQLVNIGMVTGIFSRGACIDIDTRQCKQDTETAIPGSFIVVPMPVGYLSILIGLLMEDWTAKYVTAYITPMAACFPVGLGFTAVTLASWSYLVDVYSVYAASATTSVAVVRSAASTVLQLTRLPLVSQFGFAVGFSILVVVARYLLLLPCFL